MQRKYFKNLMTFAIVAVAAVVFTSTSVYALPVPVANHSFEMTDLADGAATGSAPTFWLGSSYLDRNGGQFSSVIDPTPDAADSEQLGWTNGPDFRQVLAATLQANTTYTLTVDAGDRTDHGFPNSELRLGTGAVYGSNLLAANVISNTQPVNGIGANDGWETWVSTFTTGAAPAGLGDNLRIELVNHGGIQGLWDNVRLDAVTENAVPEPATATLAMLSLGGLMMRRKRTA